MHHDHDEDSCRCIRRRQSHATAHAAARLRTSGVDPGRAVGVPAHLLHARRAGGPQSRRAWLLARFRRPALSTAPGAVGRGDRDSGRPAGSAGGRRCVPAAGKATGALQRPAVSGRVPRGGRRQRRHACLGIPGRAQRALRRESAERLADHGRSLRPVPRQRPVHGGRPAPWRCDRADPRRPGADAGRLFQSARAGRGGDPDGELSRLRVFARQR